MCNAPNIIHAVRDVSQSFLMNAPLIEGVYKAGVRVSIEANCLKHQQDALQYTGQGRELLGLGASPTL
jgi:dihydroxyacetone kinase DhaKLM complex PTS-EIIA-like component DhaM